MSNYWEDRAANRMYEDMKTAEEAANDLQKLYRRASLYIQSQGRDIFDAFRRQTGLSESDARKIIEKAKTPTDMQAVIDYAKDVKDPVKRQKILNWVKASATQSRLARLASLQDAVTKIIPLLYVNELKRHQEAYSKIIQDAYLHKIFDIQQYAGYGKYVTPMDAKQIDRILRERWAGSNYSPRIWNNTNRLAEAVREELIVSWLTGRPQLEAWKAIDKEFQKGHHAARRLIRTESNYLANQANLEGYKASGVEKYIYVATLDLKTSEICRSMDGKVFLVKNAQAGRNYPPMHPWCRSTTIAWMPSELLAQMKRRARDPVTGRNMLVPANMTYSQWHKEYVINNQNTAQPQFSERNMSRAQYNNYKRVLGDIVPDSIEEFKEIKYNKPELWSGMKLDYRRQRRLLNNPDKALPTYELLLSDDKFTKYFFNPDNKRGWAKGQAFKSRLGYDADNWKEMRDEMQSQAKKCIYIKSENTEYGTKYTQEVVLYGKNETPMSVKIGWIHDNAAGELRMITAMPGKVKI